MSTFIFCFVAVAVCYTSGQFVGWKKGKAEKDQEWAEFLSDADIITANENIMFSAEFIEHVVGEECTEKLIEEFDNDKHHVVAKGE